MEKTAENIYGALKAVLNSGYYQGEWQTLESKELKDAELLLSIADGFKMQILYAQRDKNNETIKTLTEKQEAFYNILGVIIDFNYFDNGREHFNVLIIKDLKNALMDVLRKTDNTLHPERFREQANQKIIDENIEKLK